MILTGSLMFVCICIDVGDPIEGRCWDAINSCTSSSGTIVPNLTLRVRGVREVSGVRVMVVNATFNNISAISWRSVLVMEEAGVPGEIHRPWASNW